MYERNAIVIDRYFSNIFGYERTNNIKNNGKNYFELVKQLEIYQQASETENNIMMEYEIVANKIRETQKLQEVLNKRNLKYIENRKSLFESLDEEPDVLRKKFEKLAEDIEKNNEEIRVNSGKFVSELKLFNEKSAIRGNIGKDRRMIENDYQKILNITTENFNSISKDKLKEIKVFLKTDNKEQAKETIKEKILKNGSKEKVPFDVNVIWTAIDISTDIEGKKAEIYMSLYDKTMKLLEEIKTADFVKMDKQKKIVKDASSKLEFLEVISDYIILFLDNERMNTIGGEAEHHKIMTEACENLQKDLIEIQNMYSILIKEMTGKATKKLYKEKYNPEYLVFLQEDEKRFENDISKLNVVGTVIYPDYWRIEGMQKIYDSFKNILTTKYEKDLSEFEPLDITFDVKEEILENVNEEINNENQNEEQTDIALENTDIDSNKTNNNEITTEKILEEEFHWEDDDENDELNFGKSKYIFNDDEDEKEKIDKEETKIEKEENSIQEYENIATQIDENDSIDKKEEEEKRDKEIDEILGFFDDTSELDDDDISNFDDDRIFVDDEDDDDDLKILDDDKIFDEEEPKKEEKVNKKTEKPKKRSLFGRRKK